MSAVASPRAGLTTATRGGQGDRRDAFAHAFHPRVAAAQEEGHVGAQRQPDLLQRRQRQPQVPQAVEREQAARRVGRATAHSRFRRDALFQHDVRPFGRAAGPRQRTRCAQRQVVLRKCGAHVFAAERAARPPLEMQRIAPVQQHEGGLQQVVAVGPAPSDVQEEVELGRRGHVVQRPHRA
jgi:hypothetical protein